jgi:hypothetical protein
LEKRYKCTNQGCNWSTDHRGAMNLHSVIHCKHKDAAAAHKAAAKGEPIGCDCKEGGSWRLLPMGSPVAARGYTKYCTVCEEVV